MRTVKLLKGWLSHPKGTVLQVDNNVAFGLVDDKTATYDLTQKPFETTKVTKELRYGKTRRSYRIK